MITGGALFKGTLLKENVINDNNSYLYNFNKINVFIGSNNSGKSRTLRDFFSNIDDIKFLKYQNEDHQIQNYFHSVISYIRSSFNEFKESGIQYFYIERLDKILENFTSIYDYDTSYLLELGFEIRQLEGVQFSEYTKNQYFIDKTIQQLKYEVNNTLFHNINLSEALLSKDYNKIYIPILRGFRPFISRNELLDDIYLDRTERDYFKGKGVNSKDIFTGLSIYEDVKKLLLGTTEERNQIKEFEDFLEEMIFFEKINLIPKYDDDVLHIKIGDKPQLEIYNLGDGLQTIICIVFPIFLKRNKPTLVFIEEPETHLHPNWQGLLIKALLSFEKHQFFISTHSSSFINLTDCSIYNVFNDNGKKHIVHSKLESDKLKILNQLGYKQSDLFQTNFMVWVEGPSDKVYISHWLKTIDSELIEGQHFSIMFYGGSTYKHFLKGDSEFSLDFLKTINQNFGIILDSDRKKKNEKLNVKKQEIKKLFDDNGAFCWVTKLREIENYIAISDFEKGVLDFHNKEDISLDKDDYGDRNYVIDNKAKKIPVPSIKLSQDIFSQIQKNGDGSTKGIDTKLLRKSIETSLKEKMKSGFKIDKYNLAIKLVDSNIDISSPELRERMESLAKHIRAANSI